MACVSWCSYAGGVPEKNIVPSQLQTWEVELATFSNWFRNEVLGIFAANDPESPTDFYIAVHSTECSVSAPGTELSGSGYTRTAVSFEKSTDIKYWNDAQVATGYASGDWTVRSFSIWDNSTVGAGNYYAFVNLTSDETVFTNNAIVWQANKFILGMGAAP